VVLNLIGDTLPAPPPALVQGRKVALAVHGAAAADRAREAGAKWLQAMLGEAGAADWRGTLLQAFGPGLRLWSGCEGLETRIARARGSLFRRPLIKLLLDRVTARRDVSDAAANALLQGRGTLALVAAGTAEDHPELLPRQVWHHYEHMREARSRDLIHRRHLTLDPGLPPELDELRYRLASRLGCDVDGLDDAFDALAGDTLADERLILSLEWHVPPPEAPADAGRWRQDWLAGWLDLGTGVLAAYRRTGVLLVNMLIVRADDPAAAAAWTAAAQALYRKRRGQLGADARRGFVYHHLEPLSVVPVEDIEHFLDLHYRLGEHHPRLDPLDVAEWVHRETGGVFAETVDLMEQLHDSSFQRAYDALATAP
jgi:hypothetical protein